jgi:hypothetical protein
MQDESIKQAVGGPKTMQMYISLFSLGDAQIANFYQGRLLGALSCGF